MSGLNQEQRVAASHNSGHAIVLAGPGTGKTSTLVARHSFLRSRGIASEHILVSTFTNKAAEELKARLGKNAPSSAWIGTFHGICLRLLRRFNEAAKLKKNFKVLDPGAQKELIAKAGIVWDADDGDLTDIIGRWKDSLVSPDDAMAEATRKGNSVLSLAAEHYQTYEDEMARRGDLDFSDLVTRSLQIMRTSPEVVDFIRTRITHALVDEFQDVNKSQVEFLQALAAAGTTIWAVADDDQALYGWRGGNVRYTVHFSQFFKEAKTYTLVVNYRCDPAIIAAANVSIANNVNRVRKVLKPSRQHNKNYVVRIRPFRTEKDEAEWVASSIERYLKQGAKPRDIAVLIRTSSVTPAIQQAFEARQIPFSLSGTQSFWELPEVTAIADVLNAIEQGQPGRIASRFKGVLDLVNTMKGSSPKEAASAVGRLVGDQPPQGVTGERAALWSDACEAAAGIAATFHSATAFIGHINEMGAKSSTSESEGISITTVHSSKGLEWRHVVIAGAEASLMPHHRSDDAEEERRLFYVALTRSKGAVDITFSKFRFGKSQSPSPYLSEISKALTGAVVWAGGDQPPEPQQQQLSTAPAQRAEQPNQNNAMPKVYRRRGGKSLIPPEER